MKSHDAIQRLNREDDQQRYIYTTHDLGRLFPEDSPRALEAGIKRLVEQGVLERALKGVYLYALSRNKGSHTLEGIAKAMRPGEYSYVSLETALADYGAISQIPLGCLTVMTTGRSGMYKTPYGAIEFTHTKRDVLDIIKNIKNVGRPLRLASKQAAYRDLKRVGRNTHLVDLEVINED